MYDYIKYIESLGNTESSLVSALESFGFSDDELEQLSALEALANDIALEEDLPEVKEELEEFKEAVKEEKGVRAKARKLISSIKASLNVDDPEKKKKLVKRAKLIIGSALIVAGAITQIKVAQAINKEFEEAIVRMSHLS